jgi:hypothetical protein
VRRQEILAGLCSGTRLDAAGWARAARQMARRYRAVAALAPELVESLTRAPARPIRRRPRLVLAPIVTPAESRWRSRVLFWTLIVAVSQLARLASEGLRVQPSPPTVVVPPAAPPMSPIAAIRETMKRCLGRELAALGWRLEQARLDAIARAIPDHHLVFHPFPPSADGPASSLARRKSLGDALARQGVVLDDQQIGALVRTCFPRLAGEAEQPTPEDAPAPPIP